MLFSPVGIFGMMCTCENTVASTMRTGCPAADRSRASAGSSGTPKLAFSGWNGGGKTLCGTCSAAHRTFYDHKVRLLRGLLWGDTRVYLEIPIRRVLCTRCGKVKREALAVLADTPSTRSGSPTTSVSAAAPRASGTLPKTCTWTGTRLRRWRSSTCRSSSGEGGLGARSGWALTRSRSGKATRTGSWCPTWAGCAPSGSEAWTGPKRPWTPSTSGSGPKRARD